MVTRELGPAWGRSWPPRIIAERGASRDAPENSLRAFRDAVIAGADAIALDVMRCGTGEVVVFHERTLAMFGGGRWDDVATTPLETLQSIDLGRGERMPLLAEAIAVIPHGILIDIRLRAPSESAEDHAELAMIVMAIATQANAVERILISSEDGDAIAPFAELGATTALLVPSMPLRVRREPARTPSVVQLEIHGLDAATVRRWHARGAQVHVWPANTASQFSVAWSLGVDGVLTNDPAGMRQAVDQMTRTRARSNAS
jgi:glycerophosphoryl diester phosphodiesterase